MKSTSKRTEFANCFKIAIKQIKNYKKLSIILVSLSLLGSVFETTSIATIIPILQILFNKESTNLFLPKYVQETINQFLNNSLDMMIFLGIFMLVMIVFKNIFLYVSEIITKKIQYSINIDLQINLFKKLCDAEIKFFDEIRSGDVISITTTYALDIGKFVFILLSSVIKILRLLVYLTFLFFLSPKITSSMIILFAFLFFIIKTLLNEIREISRKQVEAISDLNFNIIETLNSIPLVKMFGREEFEKKNVEKKARAVNYHIIKEVFYENLVSPVLEITISVLLFTATFITIKYFYVDITSVIPFITAYFSFFYLSFLQASQLFTYLGRLYHHTEPFKAYLSLVDSAEKNKEKKGEIDFNKLNESIVFKNVDFGYYEQKKVLDNINFKINKGEFVAFVGPSGAGKSTIIKLLLGLYFPNKGDVFIDNINMKNLNKFSLRDKIGIVPQDVFIFNNSVNYNIIYGKSNVGEDDVINAAKTANIHELISSLPAKYDTSLGNRGVKLSGGQKQRLAIARAIIRNPELLILDEATSSLDSKTERLVQDAINKVSKNCTIVAIAHRLSTVLNADKIIVLEEGKIIGQGKHEDLMKNCEGYISLYKEQFKNNQNYFRV